jgi:hypothetical protein
MTGRRRGQSNEGGTGGAGTTPNPGTNRLSGHFECQSCLYSRSVVVRRSTLYLNSPGKWRYICIFRRPASLLGKGHMANVGSSVWRWFRATVQELQGPRVMQMARIHGSWIGLAGWARPVVVFRQDH